MRALTVPVILAVPLMIPACIPSLHPLYTEESVVCDPAIVGVWQQSDKGGTWAFEKKSDSAYRLVYRDKGGRAGEFEARLLKLENQLFLDLFPVDPELAQNAFYKFHLLKIHTFFKIFLGDSTLQMAGLDPRWLKKFVEANPAAIRHEKIDKLIVLTASSQELGQFVLQYADDKAVFGIVMDLRRDEAEGYGREVVRSMRDPWECSGEGRLVIW